MSHNTTKVNSQEPSAAGVVSQALGDLSDVTLTSPQNNDYVQYNGTNFVNVSSVSGTFQYILVGQGESNAYSNSGASNLSSGSEVRFYDSNEINTISGATIHKYSSTDWVDYINLPAGNYVVGCSCRVEFSSSGNFAFELWSGTGSTSIWNTNLTAHASIGQGSTYPNAPGYLLQYFELASAADVAVLVLTNTGVDTVSNQGNTPSEYNQLLIVKV